MNVAMAAERRRQLDAFQVAFGHLGYDRDCIRYDWSYSKPAASNGHPAVPGKLDAALFHDPREHDYSTIAFAVELGRQDLVRNKAQGEARARELFERTVAPHVVLGGSTTTDVWMNCHGTPTPILDVALQSEAMIHALDQHRSKLERVALARLRGGQGVLFDRFYEARREELAESLNEGFSSALKSHPAWRKNDRRALLSRTAIALLAARILEDKSFLASPTPYTDARRLLDAVEAKADGFFSEVCKDLDRLAKELGRAAIDAALRPIMAHLTGPISFSLVTPEMLGHLYESALIPQRTKRTSSGEKRQDNWTHYTPHTLTRHILRRLPIEELRQDQRRVLDMACGSGSFLLAGTERLSELYDAHEDTVEPSRLAHLQSRVIGYDTDEIALLVTRLTYLLAHWTRSATMDDLPEPTCAKRDAMDLTPAGFAGGQPTVIVGNPPFESGRTQLANRFLGKAIELLAPGGLLGIILPLGFLKMTREGCPGARRELLGACDLLEVWELPKHAVGLQADQETCVVLARRHGGAARSAGATLFKQTYSKAGAAVRAVRDDLRSARTFAASGLPGHPERPWSMDPDARIIASPLGLCGGRWTELLRWGRFATGAQALTRWEGPGSVPSPGRGWSRT
ncbi:N-6 DNA methylase [Sorangium sp. So ce426]|uniref:N-6 DNA methylase n=1 Tax=Sorangium sp. So ce426 TaxID=3133312 RepID=UPI003F5B1595